MKWGIAPERRPRIVIYGLDEYPAYGLYDAVENAVYYAQDIGTNNGWTEYHEMWHMKQAEDYRKHGKVITAENKPEYLKWLRERCRKTIDKLGINEHNANEISQYAKDAFARGQFDEVEAEYMTLHRKG